MIYAIALACVLHISPLHLGLQCPHLTDQITEVLWAARSAQGYTIKEWQPLCCNSHFLNFSQCFLVSSQKCLILEVSVYATYFLIQKNSRDTLDTQI